MAQERQEDNSVDPANHDVRRKRGRPRKDDIPGSEPYSRARRRRENVEAHGSDPFVGQVVSGVLDGKFDAGYMLTVRIGERGGVLRGLVFEPGLSVPISAANDIAPNVKMFKRDEVSLPFARQHPCFTPNRPRKVGVLRNQERNGSAMSSKGLADTVAEDPNAKDQMHSSVDVTRLPDSRNNSASGNLNQDLQFTVGDSASQDGLQNVQSTNVSAECSTNVHVLDVGNPSIIVSDCTKVVPSQEFVSKDKLIAQQSQTIPESKQTAIAGRPGFSSSDEAANLQKVFSDTTMSTQMAQSTSEAKQTAAASDAGPIVTNDDQTPHLHEVVSYVKPVTEVPLIKNSESKQSSYAEPVFTNGASDDYGKTLPPVVVPTSEHITEIVADANLVTEVSQIKTSQLKQSDETSDAEPVFKKGTLDDFGKAPSPVLVHTSEQKTESVADAKAVTEVSQTKTSESKQSVETSDPGLVLPSDDCGKVKLQTSEHMTESAAGLGEAPLTTKLSADESGVRHSVKLTLEGVIAEGAQGMNSSVGQELQIHLEPLWSESNKTVEASGKLLMDALASEVTTEQLQCVPASPCGASNEVHSTATGETTNSGSHGTDFNGGS